MFFFRDFFTLSESLSSQRVCNAQSTVSSTVRLTIIHETMCELHREWLIGHRPEEAHAGLSLGRVAAETEAVLPLQVCQHKGEVLLRVTVNEMGGEERGGGEGLEGWGRRDREKEKEGGEGEGRGGRGRDEGNGEE